MWLYVVMVLFHNPWYIFKRISFMIFILDFDYTLFDVSVFKKALSKSVKKLGIKQDLWQETYKKTLEQHKEACNYDVKKHSHLLGQMVAVDSFLIENEMRQVLARSQDFLYPDTEDFLRYLKNRGSKIVLLTLGNIAWQKKKIKDLKIKKYFDKFIFTARHKRHLKLKFNGSPRDWIFVNDNPREIQEMRPLFPKSVFLRLKRHGGKKFLSELEKISVPTFPDLKTVKKYLVAINKTRA
ncbi:MAG: HAD family hydrolase [bacterium]|nr:HAD family hydrolase [bacterium]